MKNIFSALGLMLILFNSEVMGQQVEWRHYGNDEGGSKYAPIDQINVQNIQGLKKAWTFRTGELESYEGTNFGSKSAFEATPIFINGVLYFDTPTNRVFAINAASGEELWRFDAKIDRNRGYSEVTSRGVTYWEQGNTRRIFVATVDGRIISLNADNGQIASSFGENGTIDLTKDIGRIQVTSPPVVIGDILITGSAMGDNYSVEYYKGVVRAFDANDGSPLWSWDPIPRSPEDPAYASWGDADREKIGAANAWAPLSVDEEMGLVFVPTSAPSVDYYGGYRQGDNNYANSVVALDVKSGNIVWHFQTVHHDVWDYDVAAQPCLVDIQKDGNSIPVVVIGTKVGHIFVLDRKSGKPVFPIEERPVPQKGVDGESLSPTQPFPILPPPLGIRMLSSEDAWGLDDTSISNAKKIINSYQSEGVFTPPSEKGSLIYPSNVGGINWGGVSFDKSSNTLIAPMNRIVAIIKVVPRDKAPEARGGIGDRLIAEYGPQHGTPYGLIRDYLMDLNSNGLVPQTKPPWGNLVAIDMNNGQIKWKKPMGFMLDPRKYPEAIEWGSISLGGALTTQGGLTFIAATADGFFRAFNTSNGELVWQDQLPAGGQASPMSYMMDGKQYVVIAAGGHGKLGTQPGDFMVAYALD